MHSIYLSTDVVRLNDQNSEELCKRAANFNSEGYRVILVATRAVADHEVEDSAELEGLFSIVAWF